MCCIKFIINDSSACILALNRGRCVIETTSTAKSVPQKKRRWNRNKVYSILSYLTMVLPGAIWLLLFSYLPMPGIVMAFKKYRLQKPPADAFFQNKFVYSLIKSAWVGLDNFKYLTLPTNMNQTLTYVRNTVL